MEPTALLREQANYIVSFVLAEVGSVGQQRVVARGPSRLMQTEDDPEAGRLRGFPQAELGPTLKVSEMGLEQPVECLLCGIPKRDIAAIPRRAGGRVEDIEVKEALPSSKPSFLASTISMSANAISSASSRSVG